MAKTRFDQYYTPSVLSRKMVDLALANQPRYVADFAAGDGQLILAARSRWPDSELIVNDVDEEETSRLIDNHPDWTVETCDFICGSARKTSKKLNQLQGQVDVVLLNPPFSNKGGAYREVSIFDLTFRCSLALSFVLCSLPYLSITGEVIAILPESCFFSQRDEAAWEYLNKSYKVSVISNNSKFAFAGCCPNTSVVHITQNSQSETIFDNNGIFSKKFLTLLSSVDINLFRGKIPVSSIKSVPIEGHLCFIHSISLQGGGVLLRDRVSSTYDTVSGPAVFIPRVGQPNVNKVALYLHKEPVVLSDCVISFECATAEVATILRNIIVENWGDLEALYTGTGARYVTIKSITHFLTALGCNISFRGNY